MSDKRQDIQGLRGWAITMVLLFHFFPNYFPNGYIGVDVFFVISGFLIAMILSREDNLSTRVIALFYYKRMKRIFPLYYLAIVCILMSLLLLLPRRYQATNMESAWRATTFTTNLKKPDVELDYQRTLLGAEDLFVHTWSLCVEIQWYLLLPIIFTLQRFVTRREKAFFTGVASCSALYYIWAEERKMTQFYSVFARIWQFACGVVAFLASKRVTESPLPKDSRRRNQEEQAWYVVHFIAGLTFRHERLLRRLGKVHMDLPVPSENHIVAGILIHGYAVSVTISCFAAAISFAWVPCPANLLRVSSTISCAVLIFIGSTHQTILHRNFIAAYVGDISYALYLIHWPVLVVVQAYSCHAGFARFVGVTISVVLAVIAHHLYEVNYLRWSPRTILLLVATLLMASVGLSFKLEKDEDPQQGYASGPVNYSTINIKDAAWNATLMRYLNVKESNKTANMDLAFCTHSTRFVAEDIRPRGYCYNKNGTGDYKILVIGNSYACNQADVVYNSFKSFAKEIDIFCLPGCEVMTKTASNFCRFPDVNYSAILQDLRPDIIFVLSRAVTAKAWLDMKKPIDDDRIFQNYMNRMDEMEQIAEKVYLLQALPSCVPDCIGEGLAFTSNGRPLREIQENLIIRDDFFARARISEVGKRCKKCEIIDYLPFLVDENGHYLGYNQETNLMYLDGVHHFNRFGKERIQLLFDRLSEKFKGSKQYHRNAFMRKQID